MNNKTYKEDTKYFDEIAKHKYLCECGHSVLITGKNIKRLCDWCGHYVYISEKEKKRDNFKKKMKGMLK